MSITKDIGRQYPLVARVDFTYASFGASGVAEEAIDLPVGAVVTGGALVITTAFNSATTDAIEVGDGDAVARFLASQDVKSAAGRFALTGTETIYRSEERRVGKECRSQWAPDNEKTKRKKRDKHTL